jgi:hypothetical protein
MGRLGNSGLFMTMNTVVPLEAGEREGFRPVARELTET